MEDISTRIAELIDQSGLSHTEFAERIGTSSATVSHILKGRNKPSLQVVLQIKSNFTNVNMDYLLSGEGSLFEKSPESFPSSDFPVSDVQAPSFPIEGVRKVEVSGVPSNQGIIDTTKTQESTAEDKKVLAASAGDSEIEQVMVLYKNGHFKVYKP